MKISITMKRTVPNKPVDAIITGDWHLREDTPTAFTGDFEKEQWTVVDFISELQKKYDCPIIHTGDLFNHWKPSPYLLTQTMRHFPEMFWTVYGNHDLPQHNIELADKCGINVLAEAGFLRILDFVHWGKAPLKEGLQIGDKVFIAWHVMTYQGKKPWPGITDPMAAKLLRQYSQFDLIATGHNHKTFTEEFEGRLLVNPGGITRQSADQIDTIPCVFLYHAGDNSVTRVDLPYTEGAISREHIDIVQQRDDRIEAFISRLDSDWVASMSFEDNLDAFLKANQVRDGVKKVIYKVLE